MSHEGKHYGVIGFSQYANAAIVELLRVSNHKDIPCRARPSHERNLNLDRDFSHRQSQRLAVLLMKTTMTKSKKKSYLAQPSINELYPAHHKSLLKVNAKPRTRIKAPQTTPTDFAQTEPSLVSNTIQSLEFL